MFCKVSLRKKTVEVGLLTLLSRLLGLTREKLMERYLGTSALSDAFVTAFGIPNALRKIFAEGAMSAALVPTVVQTSRDEGKKAVNGLITLGFLVFEGLAICACVYAMARADTIIAWAAPGFSPDQAYSAVIFLRILMPFLLTISTSSLLAAAFQSVGHFLMPAFGPSLINLVFIGGLVTCILYALPEITLCWFVLAAGLVQLVAHMITYWWLGFRIVPIRMEDVRRFAPIVHKFLLSCVSMSALEIGLLVDRYFASFLAKGSITLLYRANRLMGIPHGVFAIAFSTVLLPYFSRLNSSGSAKRLSFYLFESLKLIIWVTLPIALCMGIFADKIFYTLFLSDKSSLMQVYEGAQILQIFLAGLFFCSINKILLDVYYSLHSTAVPALIVAVSTFLNALLNSIVVGWWQASGLAAATVVSWAVQMALLLVVLVYWLGVQIYCPRLLRFAARYTGQVLVIGVPFYGAYLFFSAVISWAFGSCASVLLETIALWFWVAPLVLAYLFTLFATSDRFGVQLHFLEG